MTVQLVSEGAEIEGLVVTAAAVGAWASDELRAG